MTAPDISTAHGHHADIPNSRQTVSVVLVTIGACLPEER